MFGIDLFSLIVIGALGISGLFNGLSKEIFSSASWLISILGAWFYGPLLFPYLENYITSQQLKSTVSFLILFILIFTIFKILGSITSNFLNFLGLGILDKIGGFIFGVIKAIAILVSMYLLSSGFLENQDWWINSISREWTIEIAQFMDPLLSEWKSQIKILLNKENVSSLESL